MIHSACAFTFALNTLLQHDRQYVRAVLFSFLFFVFSFFFEKPQKKKERHVFMPSRLARNHTCKQVIQASTASSHRVGKCSFEPSKQSRIRRSSFWSHRRSTVQWETALSSKERSRRVNCSMLVPFFFYCLLFSFCFFLFVFVFVFLKISFLFFILFC